MSYLKHFHYLQFFRSSQSCARLTCCFSSSNQNVEALIISQSTAHLFLIFFTQFEIIVMSLDSSLKCQWQCYISAHLLQSQFESLGKRNDLKHNKSLFVYKSIYLINFNFSTLKSTRTSLLFPITCFLPRIYLSSFMKIK